jgi:hypothetical protein
MISRRAEEAVEAFLDISLALFVSSNFLGQFCLMLVAAAVRLQLSRWPL